jgi:excisionase family DNA binding protein
MEKLLYRVSEAGEALGTSRSKTYQLIASGELPSIRIGSSVRVPVSALVAWVERKAKEGADGSR